MEEQSPIPAAQDLRARRKHTKSRTGCRVCKRRKIKCDEKRPKCANCERHGVDCDFPQAVALRPAHGESPTSRTQSPSSIPINHTGSPRHFPEAITSLELIHLELLHNYTTLTSQTLSPDPILKNIWRINAPKMGFTHQFVMHSIFALSALHLSVCCPERQAFYVEVAQSEHGVAIREIASTLPIASADNCSALFIAASLTFYYSWAAPREPGSFFLGSNSCISEWVFLIRGVRSINDTWWKELSCGPFGPMFKLGRERATRLRSEALTSSSWLSTAEHSQLANLHRAVSRVACDSQTATIYKQTIDNLEECFYAILGISSNGSSSAAPNINAESSPPYVASMSMIQSWLYRMDSSFGVLLSERDPVALVIFAHFCVLLKFLSGCWWMQRWPTHLLQEIWDSLDEEYRMWIIWPTEELGWRARS